VGAFTTHSVVGNWLHAVTASIF